jgi:hypothetical protein
LDSHTVPSGQEWTTEIECISSNGSTLPLLLIVFKAKHTNTSRTLAHTPRDWRFSTGSSGWTSESHAYEWPMTIVEPPTRSNDLTLHLPIVTHGHGIHLTADMMIRCVEPPLICSYRQRTLWTCSTARHKRVHAAQAHTSERDGCGLKSRSRAHPAGELRCHRGLTRCQKVA